MRGLASIKETSSRPGSEGGDRLARGTSLLVWFTFELFGLAGAKSARRHRQQNHQRQCRYRQRQQAAQYIRVINLCFAFKKAVSAFLPLSNSDRSFRAHLSRADYFDTSILSFDCRLPSFWRQHKPISDIRVVANRIALHENPTQQQHEEEGRSGGSVAGSLR